MASSIGGKLFPRADEMERQDRQRSASSRAAQAEGARPNEDRRQDTPAPRRRSPRCSRKLRPTSPTSAARHAACPRDPSAGRRRGADLGGRELDQATFPARRSCGKGLHRRRRAKEWNAIRAAQQLKVTWSTAGARLPRAGAALRLHSQSAGAQAHGRGRPARSIRRMAGAARSSRPITNGRSNRMPAWARPAPSRR